jgi:multisubunit Na+/H+ antiporter MnhF subunit
MTTGGWINLILSVGFVTILFAWCIYRVLRGPKDPAKLAHIEPLDEQEADER